MVPRGRGGPCTAAWRPALCCAALHGPAWLAVRCALLLHIERLGHRASQADAVCLCAYSRQATMLLRGVAKLCVTEMLTP